jgi:PHD/YefM family antitoxin component YafN of YafNO toxin-antitoxin module
MREFVTDAEGRRTKVILDIEEYERLLETLEDLEDAREHERVMADVRAGREELIPWEQAKCEIREGRVPEED